MYKIKVYSQKESYSDKIKDIEFLESEDYKAFDSKQKEYQIRIDFYIKQKENISRKLIGLEEYKSLGEELFGTNNEFNPIHEELYERTIWQRKCIDKHIAWLRNQCEWLQNMKKSYKEIFYTIQEEIGQKGNKISKRALAHYKRTLLQKAE